MIEEESSFWKEVNRALRVVDVTSAGMSAPAGVVVAGVVVAGVVVGEACRVEKARRWQGRSCGWARDKNCSSDLDGAIECDIFLSP